MSKCKQCRLLGWRAPRGHTWWLCHRTNYAEERLSSCARASGSPPQGSAGLFMKRKTPSLKWTAWHGCHLCRSTGEQLSPALSCKEVLEPPMAAQLGNALSEMGHGAERTGCLWSPESGETSIMGRTPLHFHGRKCHESSNDFLVSQWIRWSGPTNSFC